MSNLRTVDALENQIRGSMLDSYYTDRFDILYDLFKITDTFKGVMLAGFDRESAVVTIEDSPTIMLTIFYTRGNLVRETNQGYTVYRVLRVRKRVGVI